jgi:hypothetical protein
MSKTYTLNLTREEILRIGNALNFEAGRYDEKIEAGATPPHNRALLACAAQTNRNLSARLVMAMKGDAA